MTCAKKHVSTSSSQQSLWTVMLIRYSNFNVQPGFPVCQPLWCPSPFSVSCSVSEAAYIVYQVRVFVSSGYFHLLFGSSRSFRSFPSDFDWLFPTFRMTRNSCPSLAGSRFRIPTEPVARFAFRRFRRRSVIIPSEGECVNPVCKEKAPFSALFEICISPYCIWISHPRRCPYVEP